MDLSALVFSAGLSFLFLVLVFRPLEMAFPAKPGQRFFRPAWFTDLFFFLGQYLLWGFAVAWLLNRFADRIDLVVPANFRQGVRGQPFWLQAIEVILLSDFFVY